ncbi:LOW QUALITY PROTEIN: zinc finger protein 271-like [Hippocampus comes]|nr:PREDICTED: LOW QUALITY PROTEIN: zinc finger protein 271-like [Hippocampus comes]
MCKVQMLRALLNQRLSAAVEEILVAVETTIAEYEEELCRSKEEIERQRQLLDAVFKSPLEVGRHQAGVSPEHRQHEPESHSVKEEEEEEKREHFPSVAPEQQREAELLRVKEEKKEEEVEEEVQVREQLEPLTELPDHGDVRAMSQGDPEERSGYRMRTHELDDHLDQLMQTQNGDETNFKLPNDGNWTCSECGETFSQRSSLKSHASCHAGDKPLSCWFCARVFKHRSALERHTRIHMGEKPFSCSLCGSTFSCRTGLDDHMRIHTGDYLLRTVSMDICFSFCLEMCKVQMLKALVNERLNAAVEEIFGLFERTLVEYEEELCRSKDVIERQRQLLNAREPSGRVDATDVQSSQEDVPPEEEAEPSRVKEEEEDEPESPHLTHEGGEILLEAEITKFHVKSEDEEDEAQWSHLRTEGEETRRHGHSSPASDCEEDTASDCDETDDSEERARASEGVLASEGNKTFVCSFCSKSFSRKDSFIRHIRGHTDEKPFACSMCSKSFKYRYEISRHMKIHTGEKPFSCSVCGKTFGRREHLLSHMRSHTGEKPFGCSVCGRGFSQRSHLATHSRTHTGVKPFSCAVCGNRFSLKCVLIAHMRTHTGEKPFTCSVCGNKFTRKRNLLMHMRRHTGEKSSPMLCA